MDDHSDYHHQVEDLMALVAIMGSVAIMEKYDEPSLISMMKYQRFYSQPFLLISSHLWMTTNQPRMYPPTLYLVLFTFYTIDSVI